MTARTATRLGLTNLQPCKKFLRMADQSRKLPLGELRNVETIMGGATFELDYVVLQPEDEQGYEVLIGRPWFYGAGVTEDWNRKEVYFRVEGQRRKIRIPWGPIDYHGETPLEDSGELTSVPESAYDSDQTSISVYMMRPDPEGSGSASENRILLRRMLHLHLCCEHKECHPNCAPFLRFDLEEFMPSMLGFWDVMGESMRWFSGYMRLATGIMFVSHIESLNGAIWPNIQDITFDFSDSSVYSSRGSCGSLDDDDLQEVPSYYLEVYEATEMELFAYNEEIQALYVSGLESAASEAEAVEFRGAAIYHWNKSTSEETRGKAGREERRQAMVY
ncbi:hypothetical protein R1sor_009163 [Riccia sorocarpa]|uniref:Uncharacterized protein n=1 Tax=Riccia sorocarpa TaxID=122646 RepID=A0ABD3H8W8_9MARC